MNPNDAQTNPKDLKTTNTTNIIFYSCEMMKYNPQRQISNPKGAEKVNAYKTLQKMNCDTIKDDERQSCEKLKKLKFNNFKLDYRIEEEHF